MQADNTGLTSVYGQLLNADGSLKGSEFEVDLDASAATSSVLSLDDGGFLVSYRKYADAYNNVYVKRFDSSASMTGIETKVNTVSWTNYTPEEGGSSQNMILLDNDKVLVTWFGSDSGKHKIYGQVLDLNATSTTITTSSVITSTISITSQSLSASALTRVDTALHTLNSERASIGALSKRLDHIIANNINIATNIANSISRIEDADFAAETTKLAKQQIIQQASIAMLAQANASKQNILTLLQG